MRSRFDDLLTTLNNSMIEMGALVERAISQASQALLEQDAEIARRVMEGDEAIDQMEKEIEGLCLKLLLQQQPVAKDLRQISTALKMITDMERIGDQAADISEICLYLANEHQIIAKQEHIQQMSKVTIKMVTGAIDAFVKKDRELADWVIAQDDEVDALYTAVKKDLINLIHDNVENGEQAFDLLQIAKYYERIGDHAVNLAEWVIFSITGEHKNKRVL